MNTYFNLLQNNSFLPSPPSLNHCHYLCVSQYEVCLPGFNLSAFLQGNAPVFQE